MNRSLVRVLAVLFLLVPFCFTQTITTADVVGIVTDTTGAIVPGAVVSIKSSATNETRSAVANDSGEYRFPLMQPGEYVISASTPGLKSNSTRFALPIGQEHKLDLTMNPTGTTTVVEVVATASTVQTENANLTTSYSQRQIEDLPAPGGDLTTYAMTVPGMRVNTKGGTGNMTANGVPGASIQYTLNGADVMDPYTNTNNSGASNNLLGQGEVAEVAVVLDAFSAQYGRMAGAQENIIGKSGGNTLHGNLNYNFNNQSLNALDLFAKIGEAPKTRSDAHNFGASLGGPIKRNKTFFFVDYESLRYVLPSTAIAVFPSLQLEDYALAHVPAADVPLYQQAFNLYNNAPGINRAVDVKTGDGLFEDSSGFLGCQTKGTFKGTPDGKGGIFGVTTPCARSFQATDNELNTESLFIARVDHNFSDRQKINLRYEYDWGMQATATSVISPLFNQVSNQPQHFGQVNHSYVVSPNMVNNFIGASTWYTSIFGIGDFAKANAAIPERFAFTDGSTNAQTGFTSVGAAIPNGRNVGQLQLIDDLSWNKGRHAVKFGVNYRYNKVTSTNVAANTVEGLYTFADLTDFATGQINSTSKGSSFAQTYAVLGAAHLRAASLNLYAQDDWAITRNLKISFGVRFERDSNPACVDNCFNRMNQQFGTAEYFAALGGSSTNVPYNQTIAVGLRNAYAGLEPIITEPRFGFAWSPGSGARSIVVRGGVGLFANLFALSVANNLDTNSPSVFSPSVAFGQAGTPADPLSSASSAVASFNALESGFKQGYTLAQIQASLGKIAFTPPSYYAPPQDFKAPKVVQWNFEIEKPLGAHDVFAVTYAGNHGYDETLNNNDANFYSPANASFPKGGYGGLPLIAPDPRFRTVTQVLLAGRSNHDAMIVQLRHAYGRGFQGQVGYVWSHDLGNVTISNPYNLQQGYGPLSFDTRHALTADVVWTDPYKFSNRYLGWVAAGWTVSGKVFALSGPPFSASNSALAGRINSLYTGTNPIYADVLDLSAIGTHCGEAAITGGTRCLSASQFSTTATQTDFGSNPNLFRGAGYTNIDSQVIRNFAVHEHARLGVGMQFYNLFNHPNLANPSGSVTSSALGFASATVVPPTSIYGSFQSGTAGRVIVLAGRFSF